MFLCLHGCCHAYLPYASLACIRECVITSACFVCEYYRVRVVACLLVELLFFGFWFIHWLVYCLVGCWLVDWLIGCCLVGRLLCCFVLRFLRVCSVAVWLLVCVVVCDCSFDSPNDTPNLIRTPLSLSRVWACCTA